MKISNIRFDEKGKWTRLVGDVAWETAVRPARELYFAMPTERAAHLRMAPEAFVTACLVPAMIDREARLTVDQPVCPIFLDGARNNIVLLRRWFSDAYGVRLEMDGEPRAPSDPLTDGGGMLYSGGVDSQFTLLRWSRLVAPGHPRRIGHCFMIDYNDFRRREPGFADGFRRDKMTLREEEIRRQDKTVRSLGARLHPVRTNVQALNDDSSLWVRGFHGSAMAAVAHAASGRAANMTFASSDIDILRGHGSHPFVDPNWSSHRLRVHHDTNRYTRYRKTEAVAGWAEGLAMLRVCINHNSEAPNCGRCEKCLRTMMTLLCFGKLDQAPFPANDVSAEDLRSIRLDYPNQRRKYFQLLPRLRDLNRRDLHDAIVERLIAGEAELNDAEKYATIVGRENTGPDA